MTSAELRKYKSAYLHSKPASILTDQYPHLLSFTILPWGLISSSGFLCPSLDVADESTGDLVGYLVTNQNPVLSILITLLSSSTSFNILIYTIKYQYYFLLIPLLFLNLLLISKQHSFNSIPLDFSIGSLYAWSFRIRCPKSPKAVPVPSISPRKRFLNRLPQNWSWSLQSAFSSLCIFFPFSSFTLDPEGMFLIPSCYFWSGSDV